MSENFTMTLLCPKCDEEIEAEISFDPGYPAPPCSDHDSPRFSDPGDPGYVETDVKCKCGFDFGGEEFADELWGIAERQAFLIDDAAREAAAEARADAIREREYDRDCDMWERKEK